MWFVNFLAIVALHAIPAQAQVPGPLKLAQTIPLPGLKDGDFDHFALDSAGQRLFLAAEENSTIVVIDLRTNKLIGRSPAPRRRIPWGTTRNRKNSTWWTTAAPTKWNLRRDSFKLLGTIPVGAHADVSIYDPASKLFYVGNGGRQAKEEFTLISVVDTTTDKKW